MNNIRDDIKNMLGVRRNFFLLSVCACTFYPFTVTAQVIPDNTLGAESSSIRSIDDLRDAIEGGAIRGDNLFHSFKEFNVAPGKSVSFTNPESITNIFSRITGENISEIFGTLEVDGVANLFLMNPNGIVFGKNAAINVGGSFIATTAESVEFNSGEKFSSVIPDQSLLTIDFPIGLNMGSNSENIIVKGDSHSLIGSFLDLSLSKLDLLKGLEINSDKTLALIGRNLLFDGGILTSEGGNVELASVKEGDIRLVFDSKSIVFDYQEVAQLGNIDLTNNSAISTRNSNDNSINLTAENISLMEASFVRLETSNNNPGGNIGINASSSLKIDGISPQIVRSGVFSTNSGAQTGANINIFASSINVSNGGGIVSINELTSLGKSGDIDILTNNLVIEDGSPINNSTFGIGSGGNITINAKENITVSGFLPLEIQDNPLFPAFVSQVSSSAIGIGSGGDIKVSTRNLKIKDGGNIASVTNSSANAGSISLDVGNTLELSGTTPFSISSNVTSTSFAKGNTGDVIVNSRKTIVERGAEIAVINLASGNGGKLEVNASDSIQLIGKVSNNSSTLNSINASAPILEEALRNSIGLPKNPTGGSGDLAINTPNLSIVDDSRVSVENQGTGNAGNLQINTESIDLDTSAQISASTASGQGGNITLNSENLELFNQSQITANAGGSGDGGNIIIDSDTILGIQNSDITANAIGGDGGDITINSDFIVGLEKRSRLTPNNDITATSEFGIDGTVTVNSPESNVDEDLIVSAKRISSNPNASLLEKGCRDGYPSGKSELVYVGGGGIRNNPDNYFDNPDLVAETPLDREANKTPVSDFKKNDAPPLWQEGDPVVEPNTVQINPDGRKFLVAVEEVQNLESTVCTIDAEDLKPE